MSGASKIKTHHCPKEDKGNCRRNRKTKTPHGLVYCQKHEAYCSKPGHVGVFLQGQQCASCLAEQGLRR